MFQTGSICFPLSSDAFLACSRCLGIALFFEFLSNSHLKCVRNFSNFPSLNMRTLYMER